MNARRTLIALTLVSGFAVPGIASANSVWHQVNNDLGFTFHPDHSTSTLTRAEVRKALEVARRDGTLDRMQRDVFVPDQEIKSNKTRAEVIAELERETPQERAERQSLYFGG